MAKGTTIRMWRRTLLVLILLVVVGFGAVIFSLFRLQIVQGAELQQRAVDQQLRDSSISAQRGTIYDCNMKTLAKSASVWTVVLEPAYIEDEEMCIRDRLTRLTKLDFPHPVPPMIPMVSPDFICRSIS